MARSERHVQLVSLLPVACLACTFTGLGDYEIATCNQPTGITSTVQQVGSLSSSDVTFVGGGSSIAAFTAVSTGGSCAQAVGPSGYLESTCSLFQGMAPHQPWVQPLGGGYGAAAVVAAAPCAQGRLAFQFIGPSGGATKADCGAGVALPALAPLAADGSTALVAWYETPYSTRDEPLADCPGATSQALRIAPVTGATTGAPALGTAMTLSTTSVSVRAAAMFALPDSGQVVVAAPDGDDVRLWALDASLAPGNATTIPALAGARAVSLASDGAGHLAVVAELGCAPQSIALAVGTLAGGFSTATVVAPAGSDAAVQPTVAWVASENDWIVGWISAAGGAHALARRFGLGGVPVGATIDPSTAAAGASVARDGSLFAYVPAASSFVHTSLGCAP